MKKWIQTLSVILIVITTVTVQAQEGNPVDPALISKNQKEVLKLQTRLLENREELSKLYKKREETVSDRDKRLASAQSAAETNRKDAEKLLSDTEDKKKARRAKKSANKAASEAKAARKATSRIDNIDKKIKKLDKAIQKDEAKVAKLAPFIPDSGSNGNLVPDNRN